MIEKFDKKEFIHSLENAVKLIPEAVELGKKLSVEEIKRIYFVGCGAPYMVMLNFQYWIQKIVTNVEVRNYYPAEVIHQNSNSLDDKTLIILGSYSGKTKEMIEAAEFLQKKACITLAITRLPELPLAKKVQYTLSYGDTKSGDYSRFITAFAFLSSLLSELDNKWDFHEQVISSLKVAPQNLANIVASSEEKVRANAQQLKNETNIYVVGAGPMYGTAYMLAKCTLTEMLWLPSHPIIAAEFFHGAFEVFDESTPVITLVGDDPWRVEAERVEAFCKKYAKKQIVYDTRDYTLTGIAPEVKGIFSSIVLDAATRRLVDYLAELKQHDKKQRKFMGKVDY